MKDSTGKINYLEKGYAAAPRVFGGKMPRAMFNSAKENVAAGLKRGREGALFSRKGSPLVLKPSLFSFREDKELEMKARWNS